MRKADIAKRIHQQAQIPQQEAAKLLDDILEILASTLRKGDLITILDSGKLRSEISLLARDGIPAPAKQ
jgi:nucleoid DNA-binding protein